MSDVVQIGIVGAMQRACPALTQLWLKWTGVPNLEWAKFEVKSTEKHQRPFTSIVFQAGREPRVTRDVMCEIMKVPSDDPIRNRSRLDISAQAPDHLYFWDHMRRRELAEVEGPLEWWWALLVLRHKGVRRASEVFLDTLFEDDYVPGLVSWVNPTMGPVDHFADMKSGYEQPIYLDVVVNADHREKHNGLRFDLADSAFAGKVVKTLTSLAVSKTLTE